MTSVHPGMMPKSRRVVLRFFLVTLKMMLLFDMKVLSFLIHPATKTKYFPSDHQRSLFRSRPLYLLNESVRREPSQPQKDDLLPADLIIHWKGEGVEGYSMQFRHIELEGALAAILGTNFDNTTLHFSDALNYTGNAEMPEAKILRFNQAMQYVTIRQRIDRKSIVAAVERCSLVHAIYEISCEADDYEGIARKAVLNEAFVAMRPGESNALATWCVRVRHYGEKSDAQKEKRYGSRTRSLTKEKEALRALEPLLIQFGGSVNLQNPDCKIYVFDGLVREQVTLARTIASGPSVSMIAPNTRICVTNTPLCPIAAFIMCNIAGIRRNSLILDPFAGSCATLLAAAMIEPSCRTVGIEIAHDGLVNRQDIRKDFVSRNLTEPIALIEGDCTDSATRRAAQETIGNKPFDLIITDPPYGIRESKLSVIPIFELIKGIARDRETGPRLLAKGGKLVCFLPCQEGEDFYADVLPSNELLDQAGLHVELVKEQPLNEKLSRWLVSFISVK